MPEGGCLCGAIRFSYTGDPILKALCHCTDCRKLSGSAFSTNILVPEAALSLLPVSKTPKTFQKTADSGKLIKSYFCGECGTTCFRDGESFPGMKIVKAGVLDGVGVAGHGLQEGVEVVDISPVLEGWVEGRLGWLSEVEGAKQVPRPC